MTTRTFTTLDAKGCEFKCTAFYNLSEHYSPLLGEYVKLNETEYHGLGFRCNTLDELKDKISKL